MDCDFISRYELRHVGERCMILSFISCRVRRIRMHSRKQRRKQSTIQPFTNIYARATGLVPIARRRLAISRIV